MNKRGLNEVTNVQENFDLIVVGAGSAGFSAAITASEAGARVALVNHGALGGTCVNVGCVPSKALISAAEVLHSPFDAQRFMGITATSELADWGGLVDQKDELVTGLQRKKYIDLLEAYPNIHLIQSRARLVAGGVQVDGRTLESDRIVISTGSSAWVPPIPGLDESSYLTSTEALELEKLPESLIVIGGGVIACELGQMFSRFGTKVTILCRSRLLPEEEPEISEALEQYFRIEGINVIRGIEYESVTGRRKKRLNYSRAGNPESIQAEHILVAASRRPNTSGLGLEELGIKLNGPGGSGGIQVDERMETTRPGVYAVGDVTGRDQYVYMAAYGGKIAAANALNSNSRAYDASAMPAVVFTNPQAARVGLTEAAARASGYKVDTSILTLDNVPRALASRDTRGCIKLVAERGSRKLLGAHILAAGAADSIQTAAIAIRQGMTATELGETLFPYLTMVEGLKLAAQAFDKDVAMLSCCAG